MTPAVFDSLVPYVEDELPPVVKDDPFVVDNEEVNETPLFFAELPPMDDPLVLDVDVLLLHDLPDV